MDAIAGPLLRLLIAALAAFALAATALAQKPNVVVVLIDDMGWKDLAVTGSKVHRTPNLDALAARGALFAQSYASAPNCAPTRACLMSGQYPPRHGVYTVGDSWGGDQPRRKMNVPENREELPAESFTLAEAFRAGGYATSCVGKWNLGTTNDREHSPTAQGFDEFRHYRNLGFRDGYFDDRGRYSTDVLFDEAIDFIRGCGQKPFFCFLSPDAVHTPLQAPKELVAQHEARGLSGDQAVYAAMVESVDMGMGRLQRALEQLGIAERTIVVFTSDNGGDVSDNEPLNGKKGLLYDGGIRVPLLLAGPGIERGVRPELPSNTVDLYPTLLSLCGLASSRTTSQPLDGVDLSPTLRGEAQKRGPMYFHFPAYIGQGEPSAAVRDGDYKLLRLYESGRDELYDLRHDVGETRDLSRSQKDVAARLAKLLEDWQKNVAAPIPNQPNPAYDPNAPRRRGIGGQARREADRRAARDGATTSDAQTQEPAGGAQPRGRGQGGGGGQGGGRRGQAAQGPQNPQGTPRQPWLIAHRAELDTDKDSVLTKQEVERDIDATITGYDANKDSSVSEQERTDRQNRPRTSLAGFVDQHAKEVDANGDGAITRQELADTVLRMFSRADRDGDGALRGEEVGDGAPAAATRQDPQPRREPAPQNATQPADHVHMEKVRGVVYADNWFKLYVNGRLVATDPTEFKPHDVVPVEFEATYPMTIAILAKDYADQQTGLEYDNTQIGDAGLIVRLSDRIVSGPSWRTFVVMHGPIDRDMKNPKLRVQEMPADWNQPGFDDSLWETATVYTQERVRPNPEDFLEHDWSGAQFVWGPDLDLDNTVLFRATFDAPPHSHADTEPMGGAPGDMPTIAKVFAAFDGEVELRWNEDYLFVDTEAMPSHRMMVGITAWNQQVPLPQPYKGSNSWRVPLHPRVADGPIALPYEGPVAIAANGVPIFNPIKQNGRTDTKVAGELDEFGGHAGRGDDYHYHTAPTHLQDKVGKGMPVAVSIDGYPIYGPDDLKGKRQATIDESGGHVHAPHEQAPPLFVDGEQPGYHYHGSESFPYIQRTFHGEVDLEHRPRASPVRPAGEPMRTKITAFEKEGDATYRLDYLVSGKKHSVRYTIRASEVAFEWIDGDGKKTQRTYPRRPLREPR